MKRICIFLILITLAGCVAQNPPQLEKVEPENTELSVNEGNPIEFSCKAADPDTEELTYTWYVNDEVVSDTYWYDFDMPEGEYVITVEVSDGTNAVSHRWDVTVSNSPDFEKVQGKLEVIRGLIFLNPVTIVVIDRDQLRENLRKDMEEERADFVTEQKLFEALHVWDPDEDLYQTYLDLLTNEVASYYDTEDHTFYEVVDPGTPIAYREFVASHELIHALQDQYHYLDEDFENDDEHQAFLCVVEGDAMFHQYKYLDEMTLQEQMDLINYIRTLDLQMINPFLENMLMIRYDLGLEFITFMSGSGLEPIYEKLPLSTEQVMHPEKYLTYENPVPVTIPTLVGWENRIENVFGEAVLMTILKEHISEQTALDAAAGWGGDRYRYSEKGEEYLLVVNTLWDTEMDAGEFYDAYYDYSVSWSGNTLKKIGDSIYETPTGFLAFIQKGKQVVIVESDSLEAVQQALSIMGFSLFLI